MADDTQREVLSNLPRARKTRRSSKRGESPAASSRAAEGSASAPKRAKTASTAKKKTAAKAATTAKKKPAAAKTTTAAKKPTPISSAKSSRAARAKAQAKKPEQAPPAGWATPEDAGGAPPSGLEIVTTGVRAVGELGQLGAAVAGQAVKGILSRIPRP